MCTLRNSQGNDEEGSEAYEQGHMNQGTHESLQESEAYGQGHMNQGWTRTHESRVDKDT